MDIDFKTLKLKKLCSTSENLKRQFDEKISKEIMVRLSFLRAAASLEDVPVIPPFRRHKLHSIKGVHEYAIVLTGGNRIIFRPNHDPIPMNSGEVDLKKVTSILIAGIGDYH